MRAIEITEFGGPDVLKLGERAKPEIQDGEVLIKVHAAGLNRPDLLQRIGKYPPPDGVTDIPGLEVAGEIVESRSAKWQIGAKVCALLSGGGYAEYAAAPAGQCLAVPENLSMEEAAALPETVFTVWNNLFERGKLKAGETVLVHGGTSGIGTTAIQMAKTAGAKVIVTCGTDEKCQAALELGAYQAINYKTQDFVDEIKDGVDIVLDMVGGDYVARNMKALKTDGRHVSIAFLRGIKSEISIVDIMRKRLTLTGSTLRPRPKEEKEALALGILKYIWPHIESGAIKPVIHKVFKFEDAIEAHQELEDGHHVGKIVLKII